MRSVLRRAAALALLAGARAKKTNHTQPRLLLIVGVQHSGTTLAEHFVMSHRETVSTVNTCVPGSGCFGSPQLRFDAHGNATRTRNQASTSSEYAPPRTPMSPPQCKDGQSVNGVMGDRDCQRDHHAASVDASGFLMRDESVSYTHLTLPTKA